MRDPKLILPVFLIGAGTALVGWFAWPFVAPPSSPYRYVQVAAGPVSDFEALDLAEDLAFDASEFEIRQLPDDAVLARVLLADGDDQSRVLMRWESLVGEPLLTVTGEIADVAEVGRAIDVHATQTSMVLAWWDTSRQLELFSDARVIFDTHLSRPVIVPDEWRALADTIVESERTFWRTPEKNASVNESFSAFAEALMLSPEIGVEKLHELGGDRFVLVLHALDAFKLGAMAPDRYAIGYKDFADSGQTHGLIAKVKDWLEGEGYDSYLATRHGDRTVRVFYLMDEVSEAALLSQLLPFTTSDPSAGVSNLRLVFQKGNYWVYLAER